MALISGDRSNASPLFDNAKKFHVDMSCFFYRLDDLVAKTVHSEYAKIVFKLWPAGVLDLSNGTPVMRDVGSSVLLIDLEYDLEHYFALPDQYQRFEKIEALLLEWLNLIPDDIEVDTGEIAEQIKALKHYDYEYYDEFGRWIVSPCKAYSVRLWASCRVSGIDLGVKIKNRKSGALSTKVFAHYSNSHVPVLYEIGRVKFTDTSTLLYTPKGFFGPVVFNLDTE